MIKLSAVLLLTIILTRPVSADEAGCSPHSFDTSFSPIQKRNIVEDLSSLKGGGLTGIDEAIERIGQPDKVQKSNKLSSASWVYGQRRVYDFDDCHGNAHVEYTLAYAILLLEQPSGSSSNVVCKVKELTFVSRNIRPDPYEEGADVVPGSVSISGCDEFLARQ